MPVITNATPAAIRLVMPRTIRRGMATSVAAQPTAHRAGQARRNGERARSTPLSAR